MLKRFELVNNAMVASESPECPVWVYISPDALEKKALLEENQIDQHTLSSALDPDEVSWIEFDGDRMLLIWKRPMNYSAGSTFAFNVTSVGIYLLPHRLIIVLTEDIPLTSPVSRHVPKVGSLLHVVLNFLYSTIYHYMEHLKVIRMISREVQEKINTSMENRHLIQMFNLSESLVYYENAINSNNAVLVRLRAHADKLGLPEETKDLLDDLLIENTQCFRQAEIYGTVFSGLMDARGSLVNNNMNTMLKNLTIINVVFMPLNLIAGIGGMSEFSMMTAGVPWWVSYSLFGVAMVAIGFLTSLFLRKVDFTGTSRRFFKRREV